MKRFRILPVILTICFLLYASCSEDMLKPKPLSFFSPDNIYTSKAGFESLLETMRKTLVSDSHGDYNVNQILPEAQASDEGVPFDYYGLDFTKNLVPTLYNIFTNTFLNIYKDIKDANVLISRIDNIKWDNQNDRNYLLAEAYWHRSYWYYRLVNSWGDVPFVDKEVTNVKLDYRTASRWAILKKIQADMEWAVQYMPETASLGAPTKGAANHLLAKICLANCEFDKAIAAATAVINGPYALMTTRFGSVANDKGFNLMWDLHRIENKNISANKETILAVVDRFTDPTGAKSAGTFTQRSYNCSWWHSFAKDSQGLHGTLDQGPQYQLWGRGDPYCLMTDYYAYDVWNYGGYTYKNTTDLRRADTNWVDKNEIIYNNPASVDYGKPIQIKYLGTPLDSVWIYFAFAHYKTYVPELNPSARPMGGVGDWYVYRLAETYLVRAEAYYWKGQLDLAANDINLVRTRANAIPISPGEVTLDFIMDERARELYIEEARHTEMVRVSFILAKLNKEGYSLETFHQNNWCQKRIMTHNIFFSQVPPLVLYGTTANWQPYHSLWPIPDQVITSNTGAVINQNWGYTGYLKNVAPLETIE
jgi:starch-binding outer membrane protein, SusD/RagB family